MDMHQIKMSERWAELADSLAADDRLKERRRSVWGWLRFWFSPFQFADDPATAVPASGPVAPTPLPDAGTGAAGTLTDTPPANCPPGRPVSHPSPRRPHLDPPAAVRISGSGITWN